MRNVAIFTVVVAAIFSAVLLSSAQDTTPTAKAAPVKESEKPAFKFSNVEYFLRFTDKDLHEYTPAGQKDLEKWADMVTINYYPTAKDNDSLTGLFNTTLKLYNKYDGIVLESKSLPKTDEMPPEYLIVVAFDRPAFQEVAFSRFRMQDGICTSIVYSHRIYGDKAKGQMDTWRKKSVTDIEKALMVWKEMPAIPAEK